MMINPTQAALLPRLLAVGLLSGLAVGCMPEEVEGAEPAELGVREQALSGCPSSRVKRAGRVENGTQLCGERQWINAGMRHYSKMVGARSGGKADLRVWSTTTLAVVVASSTANTSTEVIDWAPTVSDWYQVCAFGAGDWDDVRITSDVSNPALCGAVGTAVDFCFGAVGPNCEGAAVVSPCTLRSDAMIECQVAVGSQLHDTCCSHNPGGYNCGGSGNPQGWPSDCKAEWDHAQNDVTTTRQFPRLFDPTEPSYRPTDTVSWSSFSTYDARNRGRPNGLSIKTPVGKALWDVDAQNGWCQNPSSFNTYWSVQGWYAVCR
jgi:hypothetical protein